MHTHAGWMLQSPNATDRLLQCLAVGFWATTAEKGTLRLAISRLAPGSPLTCPPFVHTPSLQLLDTVPELNTLLAGQPRICPREWAEHAAYAHCSIATPLVAWFWDCVGGLAQPQLAALLGFVTGSSTLPAGAQAIQPCQPRGLWRLVGCRLQLCSLQFFTCLFRRFCRE
jgi:hypothetical protein